MIRVLLGTTAGADGPTFLGKRSELLTVKSRNGSLEHVLPVADLDRLQAGIVPSNIAWHPPEGDDIDDALLCAYKGLGRATVASKITINVWVLQRQPPWSEVHLFLDHAPRISRSSSPRVVPVPKKNEGPWSPWFPKLPLLDCPFHGA